jgi:hypothetical protein
LLGFTDGARESGQLLLDLIWRSRQISPSPVTRSASGRRSMSCGRPNASNAAGCTANVPNKLPKRQAKRVLQEIWMAETSKAAAAFERIATPCSHSTTPCRTLELRADWPLVDHAQ